MPKRKLNPSKKKSSSNPESEAPITFTSRHPTWSYLKLELVSDNPRQPSSTSSHLDTTALDPLTARTYLTSALNQFLGVSGTSIPIDILKVGTNKHIVDENKDKDKGKLHNGNGDIIWIRVPHDDASAVTGAISSWIGSGTPGRSGVSPSVAFRVRDRGAWLGSLVSGDGRELFAP